MPDPANLSQAEALTQGVLLRVAEFLRKLPPEQLTELADGTAKLEVVPKGGRSPVRATEPPPVPAEQVRAELAKIGDRAAARRWLADQGFKVPELRALAKQLDVAVTTKTRRDDVLDKIVQRTVGRRLDLEAVSRPAPARF